MENLNTDVQKMIEELNQYMLPSTLMECFDAWREAAYKQAIRSIPKSSLGWFLDMLNRFRGPEDRKESLFKVFDPSMFSVNHPAWQSPAGTVIELPAGAVGNSANETDLQSLSTIEPRLSCLAAGVQLPSERQSTGRNEPSLPRAPW
jgi:hypothetical protein